MTTKELRSLTLQSIIRCALTILVTVLILAGAFGFKAIATPIHEFKADFKYGALYFWVIIYDIVVIIKTIKNVVALLKMIKNLGKEAEEGNVDKEYLRFLKTANKRSNFIGKVVFYVITSFLSLVLYFSVEVATGGTTITESVIMNEIASLLAMLANTGTIIALIVAIANKIYGSSLQRKIKKALKD